MEWKKTWQMCGGTADLSVRLKNPRRLWSKEEKEENFEDWEVVDSPPYEEMKSFHGTALLQEKESLAEDEKSDEQTPSTSSIAERRGQDKSALSILNTSEKGKARADPNDLHPCDRCNSYHYISTCIYHLPEAEWQEYHFTYMSSQPILSCMPHQSEARLVKRNQLRMTKSGKKILVEDMEYKRKCMMESAGRRAPRDGSGEIFKERWERADKEEGSEDELAGDEVGYQVGRGTGRVFD